MTTHPSHPITAATPFASPLRRHPLVSYFVGSYALTWALVLPMTFSRNIGLGLLPYDLPDALALVLFIAASLVGPTVAAVLVTASGGGGGVRALLRPVGRWRVGLGWYLVALFANLVIWLVAYSAALGPELLTAALAHWPLLITTFLPAVAFGLLIPAIGEEPGWRGFALPRLQARYGPLRATLILGALHALWHLPALGTAMLGPLRPAELAPFLLTAVAGTFMYTFLFNRTGGSVLLAMLMHAASNAASQYLTALLEQSGQTLPRDGVAGLLVGDGWLNVLAYGVVALLLVALSHGRLGQQK